MREGSEKVRAVLRGVRAGYRDNAVLQTSCRIPLLSHHTKNMRADRYYR